MNDVNQLSKNTISNSQIGVSKLNTLSIALLRYTQLLNSGLTPYEAECATLTDAVFHALDTSPPRVQVNFGLYMRYIVEKSQNTSSLDFVENNAITQDHHIDKSDQQHQLTLLESAAIRKYNSTKSKFANVLH